MCRGSLVNKLCNGNKTSINQLTYILINTTAHPGEFVRPALCERNSPLSPNAAQDCVVSAKMKINTNALMKICPFKKKIKK